MTRPRRRRALAAAAAAAAVAALAAPAAAQAATYTVAAGGGTCGGADTACESLVEAAGVAAGGDTVQVAPGVYNEAPTFAAPGVTITGSTTAPGVIVTGTITFSGGGTTPSVLERLIVAPSVPSSPAVGVTGSAGVAVRDAFLLSQAGSGMAISNGAGNEITRSTVVSGAATGAAVDVQAGTAPVSLVLSSSILSGGPGGSGLLVRTGVGTLLPGSAAPASVIARHVTIAGSANGIALDSSAAVGLAAPAGSITATVTDSIVHGGTPRTNNPGIPIVAPGNTATLSLTRTDQAAPDAQLFVSPDRRNFHLRADAAVIDKGQLTPGDSPTDVDGQPRENGPASDLGADEFVNGTPTASFVVATPTPRSSRPTAFDATASTDREGAFGGGISQYRWTFGDGTTETTTTPTVNHTYSGEGAVAVQLVVVDRQGGTSPPATIGLRIADGTPPVVVITSPPPNRTFGLTSTTTQTVTEKGIKRKVTTRKPLRVGFGGRAKDPSGVTAVYITLQRLAKGTEAAKSAAKASAASKKRSCVWLNPKRGLIVRGCDKPVLVKALVRGRKWAYVVPSKIALGAGTYRISAYGTDGAGSFGNSAAKARRVVRFKLTG
ncbi:MAG TPA: PKD domain-containing protein [Solirubrobacteraceae bacterium]